MQQGNGITNLYDHIRLFPAKLALLVISASSRTTVAATLFGTYVIDEKAPNVLHVIWEHKCRFTNEALAMAHEMIDGTFGRPIWAMNLPTIWPGEKNSDGLNWS